MKKTLTIALLMLGLNFYASEPFLLKSENDGSFLKNKHSLFSRGKVAIHSPLGITSSAFSGSGRDWEESKITGSGFFINLGLFFPPKTYLNPYYSAGDPVFKLGFEFEIGSFFRFAKIQDGMYGLGLRVSWFSLSYSGFTDNKDIWRSLQIKPLNLGPQFSMAFNEDMGLDAYYQFGYNLTEVFGSIDSPGNSKTIGASSTYAGISNEIGAAFRYHVFSVGLAYRFGKLKNTLNYYDGKQLDNAFLDDKRSSINSFRISLGFRF